MTNYPTKEEIEGADLKFDVRSDADARIEVAFALWREIHAVVVRHRDKSSCETRYYVIDTRKEVWR